VGRAAIRNTVAEAVRHGGSRSRCGLPRSSSRSWPVLELGIGTGRIALPLSRRGVLVHGIELSPAMVARLQAQEGGSHIRVTVGDFATATVDETFTLAYLARNTIMNLTTLDQQVECFRNVAANSRLARPRFGTCGRQSWTPMARLAGMTLPGTLERLARSALHEREPEPHLRMGERSVPLATQTRARLQKVPRHPTQSPADEDSFRQPRQRSRVGVAVVTA
jgi:SAM-dependent methyltransferase